MDGSPTVPYQAYRSKRHSRTASNPLLVPNVSPPPKSRPSSMLLTSSTPIIPSLRDLTDDDSPITPKASGTALRIAGGEHESPVRPRPSSAFGSLPSSFDESKARDFGALMNGNVNGNGNGLGNGRAVTEPSSPTRPTGNDSPSPSPSPKQTPPPITLPNPPVAINIINGTPNLSSEASFAGPSTTAAILPGPSTAPSSPVPSTSTLSPISTPTEIKPTKPAAPRKPSTFRHVPLHPRPAAPSAPSTRSLSRSPLQSSPLRPASVMHSRTPSWSSQDSGSERTQGQGQEGLGSSRAGSMSPVPPPLPPKQIGGSRTNSDRVLHTIQSVETLAQPAPSRPTITVPNQTQTQTYAPSPLRPPSPTSTLTPPARSTSLPRQGGATTKPHLHTHSQSQSASPSRSSGPSPSPAPLNRSTTTTPPTPSRTPAPTRTSSAAPYRPGFQPKGVYRPLTDEFIEIRNGKRDVGRVERTRLERRLEKLIALHFPDPSASPSSPVSPATPSSPLTDPEKKSTVGVGPRPAKLGGGGGIRRSSSIFELDFKELRSRSAGDLWKGVLMGSSTGSAGIGNGPGDIRAAEQKITPWEDDASVSQCPLCTASFHPLTNRKHHCRLCGRIICSLPPKCPLRPQTCSVLFVADPVTKAVEEVGEVVDYGVKRRGGPGQGGGGGAGGGEEKFLKGVRICRDCRPVLLRQQYNQEVSQVPTFARLYDAFIALEKEIEDALPQFQELLISLSHDDQPTREAAAIRKRLLDAFSQYDVLAKRIKNLPCKSGSSQERVHMAVVTRANLFLQKHMIPLQSVSRPRKKPDQASTPPNGTDSPIQQHQLVDPDSEIAHILQPLLEQEALLETFVEEANAHRKFEDAKTLKNNLKEIRAEIDRILGGADGGRGQSGKAGRGRTR
ncbi:hypothetical protein JAAARDRAFT_31656 [Jaapia argillacea MUCL 33604]|uniref:FYVE-type domain-containing protein n=1 Tax=Jaapia argillacea MUCL 33604 TaxID=933084 RepID=A0A067Q129_9AGAM|nr:hypothetical protein JAAARDRAFT_31656 [Jaapia argillacea MUCL 33604]